MDEPLTDKLKAEYEEKRGKHAKLLDALNKLEKSEEWNILKELVFDEALARNERLLLAEATKPNPDLAKLHVLQGERNWAKQYCDIKRFADFHKSLLEELNNQLKNE